MLGAQRKYDPALELSAEEKFDWTVANEIDPITQFANRVRDWQGVWKSIDLRSVCFHQVDGWRNAIANVRLLAGTPNEYDAMDMIHEDEQFAVVQEIAEIDELDGFIKRLREGELRIADRIIRLDCPVPPVQPGGQVTGYNYAFDTQPRKYTRDMAYVATDSTTWVLQGRGRQVAEFVTTQEYEHGRRALFSHHRPYEGFPDLMQSQFSTVNAFDLPGMGAILTVLAPSYATIEAAEQTDSEHLLVRVQGPPQADARAFSLNSIMRRLDGSADRMSMELTSEQRIKSAGYARFERRIELTNAPLVNLFLIFRGEHVDEARLVLPIRDSPNPRLLAHLAFDNDGIRFRGFLFPKNKKASKEFEMAVTWLLHFCGFSAVPYGLPPAKLEEEIDVIGFVPFARAILCVECKTAELKSDELRLFANRWTKLKEALPDHDIVAAAATSLDLVTEPEREEARRLNLSILTMVELEEMLDMAERHASAQEIMEYVRRKVPSYM